MANNNMSAAVEVLDSSVPLRPKKKDDANEWIRNNLKIPSGEFEIPTNAYGDLQFIGTSTRAESKFVRLTTETSSDDVFDLLTKRWKIKEPQLLISVTGGAKHFNLDPELKTKFSNGLLKVAQTPGAWVITGGTNTGVMKHVGEALQGSTKALIGIATWGIVAKADELVQEEPNCGCCSYSISCSLVGRKAYLDHNHTHFLLVDDGTTGKYGVEISLRSQLEKHVMNNPTGVKIPSVLLVVEGGPNTLETACEAVTGQNQVPVVIIEGSGRASDVLAYALENINDPNDEHKTLCDMIITKFNLKIHEKERDKKTYDGIYKNVMECVKNKSLFTVFRMDKNDKTQDQGVDEAILTALLKGTDVPAFRQLQFTLLWNRPDLADLILPQFNTWSDDDFCNAMIIAIALNRVEFLKLFLNYGVNIHHILTPRLLGFLYGYCSQLTDLDMFNESDIIMNINNLELQESTVKLLCDYNNVDLQSIERSSVEMFLRKACAKFLKTNNDSKDRFLEDCSNFKDGECFKHPYRELFFFALLNNMQEMALYCCDFEGESILKAFFGAEVNLHLAGIASALNLPKIVPQDYRSNAIDFQQLSLQLLDSCFRLNQTKTLELITSQSLHFNNHTCLTLAHLSNHQEFIAHNAVQLLLNDCWTGVLKNTSVSRIRYLAAFFFPPYILWFDFRTKPQFKEVMYKDGVDSVDGVDGEDVSNAGPQSPQTATECSAFNKTPKKPRYVEEIEVQTYHQEELNPFKKVFYFYFKTPVIKFVANLLTYLVFLSLFAYVAMLKKHTNKPIVQEYILAIFLFSMMVEEIRQIVQSDGNTVRDKVKDWWKSNWNRLDALAIIVFFIAFGLRFNKHMLDAAHILYALNVGMWVLRLLDVFYMDQVLGPYVVMIFKMFIDMMYFMVILVVFLLAYGITSKSILVPQNNGTMMFRNVIFQPYFNIYGELFVDRDPEAPDETRFGTPLLNDFAEPIAWVLLGCYLLIANVLLLNLLIAIFNNTYEEVQSNSEQIWKFERYGLIMEYAKRPPLVPPLILICHVYMLVMYLLWWCGMKKSKDKQLFYNKRVSSEQWEQLVDFEIECKTKFKRLNIDQ